MSDGDFKRGDRRFLNRPGFHTDATVSYGMDLSGGNRAWFDGWFAIRDCDSSISLCLEVHSDDRFQNTVEKLDHLMDMCRAAKRDLRAARKLYLKNKADSE